MKTKLELAKERKLKKKQRQQKLDSDIKQLETEIQRLHEEFNANKPIDLDELIKQLAELPALIAVPFSKSLEGFLAQLETRLKTQKQPDLSKLIKDIQINNDIDLKPLQKEIANLKKELKQKEVSQLASDYQPYRRVVKLGSRFYFDDNMTSSGGGGGIDTSGLATTAKQDDIITAVNGISGGVSKPTDAYSIQAISDDGTYKYFFFEADDADYYILRKHIANKVFDYTAGTGGYSSVYQSASLGPSGSPTWGDYGSIF